MQISPKFVAKVWTDSKSALFQVMAWHQTGDEPLPKTITGDCYTVYWPITLH